MKIIQTPYFNQQNSWLEASCQLISWNPYHPFITCHRSPKIMSILHASYIGGRRCKFSVMVNVKKICCKRDLCQPILWFKNNITHKCKAEQKQTQTCNILKREGNSSSHCERDEWASSGLVVTWWHDDMMTCAVCRVKEARSNLVPVSLSSPGPGSGRLALASSHQSPSLPGAPRRQSDPDSGASTISDSGDKLQVFLFAKLC